MFNPYFTVSGLTEIELPSNERPSGILVFPTPVLSMESNRETTFQNDGCVVFLINNISKEAVHLKNHEHYHK